MDCEGRGEAAGGTAISDQLLLSGCLQTNASQNPLLILAGFLYLLDLAPPPPPFTPSETL